MVGFTIKEKREFEYLVETFFPRSTPYEQEINYLEELAMHENELNLAAKSKIKNFLVAFLLIMIFGLFLLVMYLSE